MDNLKINFLTKDDSISIELAGYANRIYISGKNETWVLGAYQRIDSFFKDKRPWFYSKRFIIILLLFLSSILLPVGINLFSKKYFISGAIFSLLYLFGFIVITAGKIDKYFPDFELEIIPTHARFGNEFIMVILAVLTLLATIVGGIIIPLIKK